uniref:FIP1 n=1 Tax=Arundo donax TaxID=35708 RepID=A0A0A9GS21_ARUDO
MFGAVRRWCQMLPVVPAALRVPSSRSLPYRPSAFITVWQVDGVAAAGVMTT